jgi:hypothetical protein
MSISVASDSSDMTIDKRELEEARAGKNHRSLVNVSGMTATWTSYPQNLGGGGSLVVITGGRAVEVVVGNGVNDAREIALKAMGAALSRLDGAS